MFSLFAYSLEEHLVCCHGGTSFQKLHNGSGPGVFLSPVLNFFTLLITWNIPPRLASLVANKCFGKQLLEVDPENRARG